MSDRGDFIKVNLPPEPPKLNPEAARVLLRIIRKANANNQETAVPDDEGVSGEDQGH